MPAPNVRRTASRAALAAVVVAACLTSATSVDAATVCGINITTGGAPLFAAGSEADSVVLASDGRAWVALTGTSQLARLNPSGPPTLVALTQPARELAAGPDGSVWMSTGSTSIVKQTVGGGTTSYATTQPTDSIAAGPDGNVWFTTLGNTIGRVTPGGVVTEFSVGVSTEPAHPPVGPRIVTGPDGSLWYTRASAGRIGRITPSGVVTEFSVGIPAGGAPAAIAAGSDGAVWFTLPGTGDIGRITPSGSITTVASGRGAAAALGSIARGSDGWIYVSAPGTQEIFWVPPSITGVGSITTSGSVVRSLSDGPDGRLLGTTATGTVALNNGCSPMQPPYVWVGGGAPAPVTRLVQDGSSVAPVTALTPVVTGSSRVSRDRTAVVWLETTAGSVNVNTATTTGTGVRTLWSGVSASLPVWSPDGAQIAFAGDDAGGIARSGVFRIALSTGAVTFVPHTELGGDFTPTDWSGDGALIVGSQKTYSCDGVAAEKYGAVAALRVATSQVTVLDQGPCRVGGTLTTSTYAAISPDGRTIAVVRAGGERTLELLDVATLARTTVAAADVVGQPAWAPDGFRVFYLADSGLTVTDVRSVRPDGSDDTRISGFQGGPTVLQWASPGSPSVPVVSPDGSVTALPAASVSTRTPVGASLTGLAPTFRGVCTFTLRDATAAAVSTRTATAAGGVATVAAAEGFGPLAAGSFFIQASCASDGTLPATNPVVSSTITSTALIYLVPGTDPAVNQLMAALAEQIPELVVTTDGAPAGTYVTPDCSTGPAPRPGSDESVASLVAGQPYTSTSGASVTPAAGCIPDAGTVYGP